MSHSTQLAWAAMSGVVALAMIRAHPGETVPVTDALMLVWFVQLFSMTKGGPSLRSTTREMLHEIRRTGYRVPWQAKVLFAALCAAQAHTIWFQLRG